MSFVWKGILKVVPILQREIAKLVRNGHNTRFWVEKWVGECPLINKATSIVHLLDCYRMVASYWNIDSGWKWEQLQHLLLASSMDELASIIIQDDPELEDLVAWRH